MREFREQIARFLESDTPVAVTRRGETLGVYVPTPRKSVKSADLAELRAAADRLAEALSDADEEEVVAVFKQMRRQGKVAAR
jgi:DNA primase